MQKTFLIAFIGLSVFSACSTPQLLTAPPEAPPVETATVTETVPLSTYDVFLDSVQVRTFNFFWETTNPENGLVPDRWPSQPFSSVAAIGFGLSAYGVGVERGYITRAQARQRTLTTLRFLWEAPQHADPLDVTGYRGFYYHFLDMNTGYRFRTTELSTIDTALLMGGALFSQSYFDRDHPEEAQIRAYADSLYRRVEWDWAVVRPPGIMMGWRPNRGFHHLEYNGYNEAMILYLLALGSPTYPVSAEAWTEYTDTYEWANFYGQEHVNFEPLFGHQYSHVWVDYRGIQDAYMREKGIDYFENSRRATLSQREYAIDNPMGWKDYGPDVWGLTASDGPGGGLQMYNGEERRFMTYSARGASARRIRDDGTLVPTAAGGSVPFAPEITLPALRAMVKRYGTSLFREYGFVDAFNPSFTFQDAQIRHGHVEGEKGWFDDEYLGIDQGPILLMIENYRTGLIWDVMKRNPYIVRGLRRAGFKNGWLDETPEARHPTWPTRDTPGTQQDDFEAEIIVLGSSTAEGVGPKVPHNTWFNRFYAYADSAAPAIRIRNLARGGYTTYHLLPTGTEATLPDRPTPDSTRNITAALERKPKAIIINLPSNDTAAGIPLKEQQQNYERIIGAAEAADTEVWITTTLPRDLDGQGRQALMHLRNWIFERFGTRAIDIWTGLSTEEGRLAPPYRSGDNLHLNDAAHDLLFQRIRAAEILEYVRARR